MTPASRRPSIGTFTTNTALVVQSWDAWMAQATGLPESAAIGEPLVRLYPELAERGLLSRLRRVSDGAGVEVLAPAFHKYLIPCVPRERSSFDRMRQHVTISPLRERDAIVGVIVTIEDVTPRMERDRQLAADLDSDDEVTRLRAAEALAATGEAPALLAQSLGDESWRVRRVAADSIAESGGEEVVRTLVEALHHHHRDPGRLNAALAALAKTHADAVMSVAELLKSDDAEARTYAALALGLIGDPRAVPMLVAHLDDPDPNASFHVIEALGRIGHADSADALVEVAQRQDFFLSFAALDALAAIGEPAVMGRLFPLLDNEMLRPAVVACLGSVGMEEAAAPLARLIAVPNAPVGQIARALVAISDRIQEQIGEGAVIADLTRSAVATEAAAVIERTIEGADPSELRGLLVVLSWLPDESVNATLAQLLLNAETRPIAAGCLATRGVHAVADIIAAVRDQPSIEAKRTAANVLERIGSREAVPTLIEWLDGDPALIVPAAAALGAIGDRAAFTALLPVLDHPDAAVRQAAVAALNSIGHPKLEETVSRLLRDESPRVRESAARVAGYFGYESCLRIVVELCDDEDEVVRRSAVEHLASYDSRAAWSKIHETLASDPSATVRAAAARAMGTSASVQALDALVAATEDQNLWVRYFAIRALGRRGAPQAAALACLAECATRDDAPPVRIAAIESLAALGAPSMLTVIQALTHDRDADVACAALAALAAFPADGSASVLRAALQSDDSRLVSAALESVARLRVVDAVSIIVSLIRERSDDEFRRTATRTLARIGGHEAVGALLELSHDRRLREPATAALGMLDSNGTRALRDGLAQRDEYQRRLIVDALGRTKNDSAAAVLSAALGDSSPAIRLAAARALGRIQVRDARAHLTVVARTDEHPAVRLAAQDALSQ